MQMEIRLRTQHITLVLVCLGALLTLLPLVWMLLTSFKSAPEIQHIPPTLLPRNICNLSNYQEVLNRQPFLRFIINSLLVSLVSCTVSIFLSSMAGYGFAKFSFRGKEVLFFAILSFLIVPFEAVVVPLYSWITRFGLVDTYSGITLPLLVSAFGVFLMRQSIEGIPNDYIDAARIDGDSELGIFCHIILPMVKPGIATLGIIKFMWSWNEFLWPLVVTNSTSMKVVTIGLHSFTNMYFTEYHLVTAATVLSIIPTATVFALFQRWIVRGITMSGLKG